MRKAFAKLCLVAAAAVIGTALLSGTALAKTPKPKIKSVSFVGPASEPTVIVKGTGLGSLPIEDAETLPGCYGEATGNDFGTAAWFEDNSQGWTAGEGPGDCIGLIFKEFTETEVIFYFGSAYGVYTPIHKKDSYTISLNGLTRSGKISIKK